MDEPFTVTFRLAVRFAPIPAPAPVTAKVGAVVYPEPGEVTLTAPMLQFIVNVAAVP